MYRGKGKKQKRKFEENLKKKKFQSALFSPLGRWTGNNFLFKGGLTNTFCCHMTGSPIAPIDNQVIYSDNTMTQTIGRFV